MIIEQIYWIVSNEGNADENGIYTTNLRVTCRLINRPDAVWYEDLPQITHSNSQTGAEVDAQRVQVINDFITNLNNTITNL